MPKFLICFRVEQVLSGSIEVEAESVEDARARFATGDDGDPIEEARLEAKLSIEDSEDSITEIQAEDGRTLWTEHTLTCSECGGPMYLDANEVSHHGEPGDTDFNADADHVALIA